MRARWHTLRDSRTVRIDGVTLIAEANRVGAELRQELIRGTYEFAERRLMASVMRPGDRVFEIGAGIGCTGLLAAQRLGAENVVSFEANPENAALIDENHSLNGLNPTVIFEAVTRDGGPVTLYATENLLAATLSHRPTARTLTVPSTGLNAAIAAHRPTVLVCDAEGAEADLLTETDLPGIRAIIVETHAKLVGQAAIDTMIASLEEQGFRIRQALHRNLLMVRDDADGHSTAIG